MKQSKQIHQQHNSVASKFSQVNRIDIHVNLEFDTPKDSAILLQKTYGLYSQIFSS